MLKQLISATCLCAIVSVTSAQELTVVNTDNLNAPVHVIFKGLTNITRTIKDSIAVYSAKELQKINTEPTYKEQTEKAISEAVAGFQRVKFYTASQTSEINNVVNTTSNDVFELTGKIKTMLSREVTDTSKNVKTSMIGEQYIEFEIKNLRTKSVEKFSTNSSQTLTHLNEDEKASTATVITVSVFKAAVNYVEATVENALAKAIDATKTQFISKFRPFAPIYGCVTKIGETKKEKVKTLSINLGSAVSKGNTLEVHTYNSNGTIGAKIGAVKITSVLGNDKSDCSVSSGAKDIYKNAKPGNTLIVVYK